jgi:hypothetical protein
MTRNAFTVATRKAPVTGPFIFGIFRLVMGFSGRSADRGILTIQKTRREIGMAHQARFMTGVVLPAVDTALPRVSNQNKMTT